MAIIYDEAQSIFHLQTQVSSYVMQVVRGKYLSHLYWGRRVEQYRGSRAIIWKDRGFAPNPDDTDRTFSLDTLPQEYPQTGNGDFRTCAYGVRQENGSRISSLLYDGYEILPGKRKLQGLPASFGTPEDVETLVIRLRDEVIDLVVELEYNVFDQRGIITRSVRFINEAQHPVTLTKMLSMSVDFREQEFDVLTLYGAQGLHSWNGEWYLHPGETFQTPEVVMAYTHEGLNGLSHLFHTFYRRHLMRGKHADALRPILINNWEATFFRFTEEKLLALARKAAETGIELFVPDDGWFGHRDGDNSSLGDWFVDERKLPHGLPWLADQIHGMGMQFGLWFEPEMISQDSQLYREHPDYVLHAQGRPYTIGRGQLVLDLSRKDVCDHVIDSVRAVLASTHIDYVKWDMNRHLTEVESGAYDPCQQGEISHRYVLGLYYILETLTSQFPDILFEGCSSGGGRFDAGMLYYMPQSWCSDNTDAVCRMKIQYATSLTFPPVTMGAHVSVVPNQQTGRVTPPGDPGLCGHERQLRL